MTVDIHYGTRVKIHFINIDGFNQYTLRSTDGRSISVENCIVNGRIALHGGSQIACARASASHHRDINRSGVQTKENNSNDPPLAELFLDMQTSLHVQGRRFLLFCYLIIVSSPNAYMQIKIDID
jgi:hypothetical protein